MATRERGHRILVAREKHATRYFDAATDDLLHAAALTLITERLDPEYAFILKPDPLPPITLLTDEQIAALPEQSSTRKHALAERAQRGRAERQYQKDLAQYELAERAVREGDGKAAYTVLQQRAGYEYEGYSLEYLETGGPRRRR